MPHRNPITLVEAILGAQLTREKALKAEDVLPAGPTVTLSRDFGCGALAVGKLLSDRLHVQMFDREILDKIAERSEVDPTLMERLDEQVSSWSDDWLHSLIYGKSLESEDYKRHLINVVLGIARQGGIIVGRGAHLILHERRAFHVRITSSPDNAAKRIARNRGISEEEAHQLVEKMNKQRRDFIRHHFKVEHNEPFHFDMILNADRFSTEEIADLVVEGMIKAGFLTRSNALVG